MKTLGLIGGMSWESTALYYRELNRLVRERLGGQSSAPLILWSVDFAPVARMQAAGEWDALTAQMIAAARKLELAGAQALMICANTMHLMAPEVRHAVDIPLLHVAEAAGAAIARSGARRPLLLGTRFTMERPFYAEALRAAGLEPSIPPEQDRAALHAIIFDELVQGRVEPRSREVFVDVVEQAVKTMAVDCAILGCTEFGLLVTGKDLPIPAFDTTEIHARAGADFILGSG